MPLSRQKSELQSLTEVIAPRSGTAFNLESGQVLRVIDYEG